MNNIPRSAARSMIRAEQKRQVRQAIRQVAPGEKIMGALMPSRGFAFPGGWSQDRIAQVQQMRDWTGVCIDKLASLCAQLVPNAAYVRPQRQPTTQKDANRFDPRLNRMQYLNCEGHSFYNNPYRAKALGVIKPHEELESLPQGHPIVRLIQNPNDWETQYEHDYEIIMFLMLTGVAYDWMVPDPMFTEYPGELWCIPSHWVWPRSSGGQVVSPQHPNADRLIEYYEIRPWGGLGTAGVIRIPPEEMIRYAHKSPINKIDGLARTQIGSLWIDSDNSIAMCQRSMMTNGIYPSFWLEMGEGFSDLTDDAVDRVEAKIYAKLGGENRFGRPFISSQGTKPHPLVFPPNQYAFADSGDQSRNRIVSLFGLNLPVLGLSEDQTFGSVLANLMSVSVHTLKPLLTYIGQAKTKFFASKFSTRADPIKMWYDDPTPVDPQQLNEDIKTDFGCGAITPNMILTLRGRPVYEHGGDDPILPMGSVPMPLNTGVDLSGLAELVPLLGRQENPASEEEEAEAGLGSPQVEEPNGKPSKPKKGAPNGQAKKSRGGRLKEFSEADHPRGQPDNAGQFGPASGVPSISGSSEYLSEESLGNLAFINYNDPNQEPNPLNQALADAELSLQDHELNDAGSVAKLVDSCVDASVKRNNEALKLIPKDDAAKIESWAKRQIPRVEKRAADLSAKVEAYQEAIKAVQDHESSEPPREMPETDLTRPEPEEADFLGDHPEPQSEDFSSESDYNSAYDKWEQEEASLMVKFHDAQESWEAEQEQAQEEAEKAHYKKIAVWERILDKLQVKEANAELKSQEARDRFSDALWTMNTEFADKVMDIAETLPKEPKKSAKSRTVNRIKSYGPRSALPKFSTNGVHK